MKKFILFTAVVCAVLAVSCRTEPPEEEFFEVWHSTQHHIKVEVPSVFPPFMKEEIKQREERESIVTVSEDENYRMNLREDGSGSGSGFTWRTQERFNIYFTWQLTDSALAVTGAGYLLVHDNYNFRREIVWNIEERTADTMVLSTEQSAIVDGIDGSAWTEECTLRYTFERVK